MILLAAVRLMAANTEHGVEPGPFLAVFIAGMATMAAVAALIYARRRPPT